MSIAKNVWVIPRVPFGRSREAEGKRRAVLPDNATWKISERPIFEFVRRETSPLLKRAVKRITPDKEPSLAIAPPATGPKARADERSAVGQAKGSRAGKLLAVMKFNE
jgi:hypothetical protein